MTRAAGRAPRARGQAVVETAVFLPFFLLGLFAMIWAIRTGVVSERAASSTRYALALGNTHAPWSDTSVAAMIATARSVATPVPGCSPPPTVMLTQNDMGAPYAAALPSFWRPNGGTPTTATCTVAPLASVSYTTGHSSETIFFNEYRTKLAGSAAVPWILHGAMGATTAIDATAFVHDQPSVNQWLHCYPELETAVIRSLKLHQVVNNQFVDDLPFNDDALPVEVLTPGDLNSSSGLLVDPSCSSTDNVAGVPESIVVMPPGPAPTPLVLPNAANDALNPTCSTGCAPRNGPPPLPNESVATPPPNSTWYRTPNPGGGDACPGCGTWENPYSQAPRKFG